MGKNLIVIEKTFGLFQKNMVKILQQVIIIIKNIIFTYAYTAKS